MQYKCVPSGIKWDDLDIAIVWCAYSSTAALWESEATYYSAHLIAFKL